MYGWHLKHDFKMKMPVTLILLSRDTKLVFILSVFKLCGYWLRQTDWKRLKTLLMFTLCIELYSYRRQQNPILFTKPKVTVHVTTVTVRLKRRSFLPCISKEELPPYYQPWMDITLRIPELVHSHELRSHINKVSGDNKLTKTVHYVYGAII